MTSGSRRFEGQIAFEYMFIFAIFMVALIIGAWFAWNSSMEVNRYHRRLEVEDLITSVAEKINTVWLEGHGFSTNITIPETVVDNPYTMQVISNYVLLTVLGEDYTKPIITRNVSGNFTLGTVNLLSNMGDHINISTHGP